MPEPHGHAPTGGGTLRIVVRRSGGIAGLTRTWTLEPASDEHAALRALIRRCPWEHPAAERHGADRFSWEVLADDGATRLHATLGETEVEGAWRELVDTVRTRGTDRPPEGQPR